jgi:carbonic anhydrase/acetyltransferase-like protein (isoleucine patch superfamily)
VLHVSHPVPIHPEGAPLLIGNDVTVGHSCILHGCHISDACLIGMGCIVMDRTHIEPEVLLGAGSLVPEGQTLQSGYLYLGRPAKRIRPLTDEEIAYLYYSSQHYVRLAAQYRDSGKA